MVLVLMFYFVWPVAWHFTTVQSVRLIRLVYLSCHRSVVIRSLSYGIHHCALNRIKHLTAIKVTINTYTSVAVYRFSHGRWRVVSKFTKVNR